MRFTGFTLGSGLAFVTLAALGWPAVGRADFIFLRDGYTLRGKLQIEGSFLRDPAGRDFWIKKLGGFYMVDDGARRVVFSSRYVREARTDPADAKEPPETYEFRPALYRTDYSPGVTSAKIESATPWNKNGERSLTLVSDKTGTSRTFEQCLTLLQPHYAKVGARRWRWNSSLLTNELDPAMTVTIIRQLLAKRKPPATKIEENVSVARFCKQAGWYNEAEAELQAFLKDFPEEKEKVQDQVQELRRLQAHRRLEAIELALKAGQYQRLEELLSGFPDASATDGDLNRVHAIRNNLKELQAKLESSRRFLAAVQKNVKNGQFLTEFKEALAEIEANLNLDTCLRLEAFVLLALQEDRNRAQDKSPKLTPEQLLALAVSSWIMGNAGAESDIANARQLWLTRQFLLRYLRTADAQDRGQMLEGYVKGEALPYDVIGQMIQLLPPPFPLAGQPKETVELTTEGTRNSKGVPYLLQIPPEYHHHRPFPLLIVPPNIREEPKDVLRQWGVLAAQNGYLLAVPRWADLLQEVYQFTEREHEIIPAVLGDVRRRCHVDSDRVFLAGFDQAGNMVYDVGMSHPDLFAGAVVIGGRPGRIGKSYRANTQYLPFYVVEGERSPNNTGENRDLFDFWVTRGYPSLYVEYVGRGLEFFPAELPYIFDWLSRKRRARGLPDLGGQDPETGLLGRDFCTARPTDNRFYWISSDNLNLGGTRVATVSARVINAENAIAVSTTNFRQLSVWLNGAMVDFEQPIEVRVNVSQRFKKTLKPSVKTLLEDFYRRGDKRHLYVARFDVQW